MIDVRMTLHNMELRPGVTVSGSIMATDEYAKALPHRPDGACYCDLTDRECFEHGHWNNWKPKSPVTRGEDGCMAGRGGKCVICGTGDCLRRPD